MEDAAAGVAAWRQVESVLTHPRCLNCHTMTDYPRQGDERRVHALEVQRGPDGHGASPRCQACHTDANQTSTGIPGAEDWHMAPLAFAWESKPGQAASSSAICATLTQGDDGGAPDYERLIEYAQLASFVHWAWEPGTRRDGTARQTPALGHGAFVDALKRWISAGSPCPLAESAAPVAGAGPVPGGTPPGAGEALGASPVPDAGSPVGSVRTAPEDVPAVGAVPSLEDGPAAGASPSSEDGPTVGAGPSLEDGPAIGASPSFEDIPPAGASPSPRDEDPLTNGSPFPEADPLADAPKPPAANPSP